MKKAIKMVLVLALAVLCLTAVAAAAEGAPASGICDVTVESGYTDTVTVKALKADKTEATATTQEGKTVYADAVRLEVKYTAAEANKQYVVLVLNDGNTVPTESNVAFIDQNGTATFDVYPGTLENGKTYDVYISSNAASGIHDAVKVASFGYYAAYTPGDVNEDGAIDTLDAMQCFSHFVGNTTLTGNQFLAADVADPIGTVDSMDGMRILNFYVGNINAF